MSVKDRLGWILVAWWFYTALVAFPTWSIWALIPLIVSMLVLNEQLK